jgi:hypothetical protein
VSAVPRLHTGKRGEGATPNTALASGIYIPFGESELFCPGGDVPAWVLRAGASGVPPPGGWGETSFAPPPPQSGVGLAQGGGLGPQAESVYPAIVQPILPTSKWEYGHILGCNEHPTDLGCGQIMSKVVCSRSKDHESYLKHRRCNDPCCPTCYPKFASRISEAVAERVAGWQSVYPEQTPYHLVFWGKKGVRYANITEAFADAKKMYTALGMIAAVVWYHPYRIRAELKPALRAMMRKWKSEPELCRLSRKNGGFVRFSEMYFDVGFWKLAHDDALGIGGLQNYVEYGPHFHAVGAGYLVNSRIYAAATGCGYKKKGYLTKEDAVPRLAYYLSTHACYEWTKTSTRRWGTISDKKLAKKVIYEGIEDVRCPDCGTIMQEYDCDESTGECLGMLHDRVTCKVQRFLYWIRGGPEPAVSAGNWTLERFVWVEK